MNIEILKMRIVHGLGEAISFASSFRRRLRACAFS